MLSFEVPIFRKMPGKLSILLILALSGCFTAIGQDTALIDSLERKLPSLSGGEKVLTLNDLSWEYGFSDPQKSYEFAEEAVLLAETMGDSALVSEAVNILAIANHRLGRFDEAIQLNHRALSIRRNLDDLRAIGSSLSKIGLAYQEQMILDSAIVYQLQALEVLEKMEDQKAVAQTYLNIASLFDKNKDPRKAMEYAEKALELTKIIDFPYAKAGALGTLSMLHSKSGNYDASIETGSEALVLFRELNSRTDIATQLNNLGYCERLQGRDQLAASYYREAFEIASEIGDEFGIAKYGANLGAVLVTLKEFEEADRLYRQSLTKAEAGKYEEIKRQCLEGIANAREGMGDHQSAWEYFDKFMTLDDSLFTAERNLLIQELDTRYRTERMQSEHQELQRESQLEQMKDKRMTTFLWTSSASLVLLAAAVFLFISRMRSDQKNRHNSELLRLKRLGLDEVLTATNEERRRIAAELHDSIGQQLSGMKLAWEKWVSDHAGQLPPESDRISLSLADACKDVRSISHQMMPRSLTEIGLVAALSDLLDKQFRLSRMQYSFEHFNVSGRLPENVEVACYHVSKALISAIIAEDKAGQVTVQLLRNKNHLVLLIEDDAVNSLKEQTDLNNELAEGQLHAINGEIRFEPLPEKGTVATIRIPLA